MNAHVHIPESNTKSSREDAFMDLEPEICHLAREARASQMMATELVTLLRLYCGSAMTGAELGALTREAIEMLEDFSSRVANGASDLRVHFYRAAS